MNGISDSVRIQANVIACEQCGATSRVARGLCLNCLLQGALSDIQTKETLEALLAEIDVRDTEWRIGNYQILEEIGRGGMGVIYRARQRHSRRIVALKRMLGYQADSQETLARFRREAEAAASLDHPNILPIYEVSESDDGLPFFSMKFAAGGSLLAAAPALRNEPRRCVALMAKVTRAVQYAHLRGILHRDLKPGNILLDGRGEPLVSDFGLAKWLDTSSDLTRTLTIFGTPGYIAPEQAKRSAANLTPAADVYSLGAILFDLFTGHPPFLGEHALAVIQQASEKPAPKLRSLVPTADRDLETICAKCLEREPTARYRSAGDVAEDLERWVEGRPIVARPVSPPVRVWRWSKRNPKLAVSIAACAVLILAVAFVGWQLRGQAEMKVELAKLRQGIMEYPHREAEVRSSQIEQNPAAIQEETYAELGKQLGVDPKILREKLPRFAEELKRTPNASLYERANASYVLKDYAQAERLALEAAAESQRAKPSNLKNTLAALQLAGLSAQNRIDYARAMEHFRAADQLTDRNRSLDDWAMIQHDVADLLVAQGKYGDAERVLREVIQTRAGTLGSEHPDTLDSRHRLIYALTRQTKYAEAESEARLVLSVREKFLGLEHKDTVISRYNLADTLADEGKYAEAEDLYRNVIGLNEKALGSDDPRTIAARVGLATVLGSEGKNAEAESLYREVIKFDEKLYGPEHPNTLNDRMNLATALHAEGKHSDAEHEYREVIKLEEKVIGAEHPDVLISRNNLAEVLDDEGKFAEAERECRQIINVETRVLGPENLVTLNSRANLAIALIGQKKFAEAHSEYSTVLTLMERALGLEHPDTLNYATKFVTALSRQNRIGEASEIARGLEERAKKSLAPDNDYTRRYSRLAKDLEAKK